MRLIPSRLNLPGVLSGILVAASLGCGCIDDHAPPPAAPLQVSAATRAADAQLRARCTTGLVPPANGFVAVTEIPQLGGGPVFPQDIDDAGVTVGSAQLAGGGYHAIRHTDLGGVEDLGARMGFGARSYASAIAPDDAIAGHADHGDGTGVLFGFRYTVTGGRVEVCSSGCSVWDMNGHGQAVGLLLGRNPSSWQAFLWSQATGLRALGTLGGARSSASGISESGLVVGNAQLPTSAPDDVGHAFIYDSRAANPALQDLNARARSPGWVLRGANDVNETYVVGYGTHDGQSRAFRMTLATGEVDDLGTLGAGSSVAWAVDGAGDVIGWVAKDAHSNVAVVYGPGLGGLRALNELVDPAQGWVLEQANGINAHGTIVGTATHNGVAVGFKLTLPLCGH